MQQEKHGNPIAFLKWVANFVDENGNHIEMVGDRWSFSDKPDDEVTEDQLWELYLLHYPDAAAQSPVSAGWVKANVVKVLEWAEKFQSENGVQLMLDENEWYVTIEDEKEIGTHNCKSVTAEDLAELYLMHHPDESPSKEGDKEFNFDSYKLIGRSEERFNELIHKKWEWRSFYNGWVEGRVDLYDEVRPLIKGEQMNKDWVDVNDRLPDEGGRYWCYVQHLNDLGLSHFQWNCDYNPQLRRFSDMTLTKGEQVTHWRPLMPHP